MIMSRNVHTTCIANMFSTCKFPNNNINKLEHMLYMLYIGKVHETMVTRVG